MYPKGYLQVTLLAAIVCLPVYCGFFALKHDFMAFDWPIHFFTGKALQQGIFPMWLDTWNFGFPLQSVFSWSVFSTIFQAVAGFSGGSLWWLQVEWCFFIWLGGVGFLKLLRHFSSHYTFNNVLFAATYMLSGAVIGASQWMFYLSALGLFPLCVYFLLRLLQQPTFRYALLFPVSFFVAITHVHVFFAVVFCYILFFVWAIKMFSLLKPTLLHRSNKQKFKQVVLQPMQNTPHYWQWLAFSLGLLFVLAASVLYHSLEVLPFLVRSNAASMPPDFARSNYLHPLSLSTLLVPLAQVKSAFPNTEPLFQHLYLGLAFPLLVVLAFFRARKALKRPAGLLGGVAILFCLFAFGYLTPLFKVYQLIPGMAYFRHSGLLRLFAIGFVLAGLAIAFYNNDVAAMLQQHRTLWSLIVWVPVIFSLVWGLAHTGFSGFSPMSNLSQNHWLVVSAIVQAFLMAVLFFAQFSKLAIRWVLLLDIVLQALLLMPVHTLSSYSVAEVEKLLTVEAHSFDKAIPPDQVNDTLIDYKGNKWLHNAVFAGAVSHQIDKGNPLTLKAIDHLFSDSARLAAISFHSMVLPADVGIEKKRQPGKITIALLKDTDSVGILQANFPGWRAKYGGIVAAVPIGNTPWASLSGVNLSAKSEVTFYYYKPWLIAAACLGHLVVIFAAIYGIYTKVAKAQ